MNAICTLNTNLLYETVVKANVPFFRWAKWIDEYINKEFMRIVISNRRKGQKNKPMTKTFAAVEK